MNFDYFNRTEELEILNFENEHDVFDNKLSDLKEKSNLNKFPIFAKNLEKHSSSRTYSFRLFECTDNEDENVEKHYNEGYDSRKQHLP